MNITASGTHYFPQPFAPGRNVLLDVSGTFGGASVTPGYLAADGAFSPYLLPDGSGPIVIASRGGFQVRVPRDGQVGVSVSGATGTTDITLDAIHALDAP